MAHVGTGVAFCSQRYRTKYFNSFPCLLFTRGSHRTEPNQDRTRNFTLRRMALMCDMYNYGHTPPASRLRRRNSRACRNETPRNQTLRSNSSISAYHCFCSAAFMLKHGCVRRGRRTQFLRSQLAGRNTLAGFSFALHTCQPSPVLYLHFTGMCADPSLIIHRFFVGGLLRRRLFRNRRLRRGSTW